jgi:hypothetical protein
MHMVIFRATEGRPSYHQVDDLEGAVGFVEHLRNTEEMADVRIFRMDEIPIAFKTYYRVEVTAGTTAGRATTAEGIAPTQAYPGPEKEQPVPLTAGAVTEATPASEITPPSVFAPPTEITPPTPVANGRFGLFSRG